MLGSKGVLGLPIHKTPIAVIDFETTGLTPGFDRAVEISVYRLEPEKKPYLAFDTLVNPKRPMAATEIHGITEDDVADAPTFPEITGNFVNSLSGCVVASYNIYFDIKFLDFELQQAGIFHRVPHICLMYMRPALDLGKRCNLSAACQYHNIDYKNAHIASADAEASAKLMEYYLDIISHKNINTFGDLHQLRGYKFFDSFVNSPLPESVSFNLKKSKRLRSRAGFQPLIKIDSDHQALNEYWDALRMVIADLEVTDNELSSILQLRRKIQLPKEKIRMLHAKAFAAVICQFIDNKRIDDQETVKLQKLHRCLSKLGWAPGG